MPTAANFLGSFEPQGLIKIQASKGNSSITKGDLLALSSNKWVTAPTSSKGPFAVALETKAASDTVIKIAIQGVGYVKAQGAINANSIIMCSTSVAGSVAAYSATAVSGSVTISDVQNARDEFRVPCGRYLGHENEGDGSTEPTAAADGDTIRIWLGGAQ